MIFVPDELDIHPHPGDRGRLLFIMDKSTSYPNRALKTGLSYFKAKLCQTSALDIGLPGSSPQSMPIGTA